MLLLFGMSYEDTGKSGKPNLGWYTTQGHIKVTGQYKNSLPFLYSYTLVFVQQILLAIFPQVWGTKQGTDPTMKVSAIQAVLRYCQVTTAYSEWHLWASGISGWARETRHVCVLVLQFPLVSDKLQISVCRGGGVQPTTGRKVVRAQPASLPAWRTAAHQAVALLFTPSLVQVPALLSHATGFRIWGCPEGCLNLKCWKHGNTMWLKRHP